MHQPAAPIPYDKIVIASHNRGKIREINLLLQPFAREIIPVGCFSGVQPKESGMTFDANALIKARHACVVSGLPALADDSGLEILALDHQPGIHSARFAEDYGGFPQAMAELLKRLSHLETPQQRKAQFVCALGLVIPSSCHDEPQKPREYHFTGFVQGHIAHHIDHANHGFGYDPIFIPDGHQQTFASLQSAIKNTLSHRKKAFDALLEHFLSTIP